MLFEIEGGLELWSSNLITRIRVTNSHSLHLTNALRMIEQITVSFDFII